MKPLVFLSNQFHADRERLLLWLPVCIGVGIALYFALLVEPVYWIAPIVCLSAFALAFLLRKTSWWMLCVAVALAALGFANAQWRTHRLHTPVLADKVFYKTVEGTVVEIQLDEKAHKVVLKKLTIDTLSPQQTPKTVRINFRKWDTRIAIGDRIAAKATLFPLPTPVSPGAFDFGQYLYFKGLGGVGFSPKVPELLHAAQEQSGIDAFRYRFASDLITRMAAPYGAIAAALTVGEQQAIPEEVNKTLRDSGLYHILSISGLHLAIATGLVFYVVRLLLALIPGAAVKWPIKKIAAIAALVSGILYLLAAGSPVPAQRSCIMVSAVFIAILLDRQGISMVSLMWAAIFILLLQPESLITASFQLSFAATAAIVALYESERATLFNPSHPWLRKIVIAIAAAVMVSLVATLATAPFVMTHFNRLQLLGMVANAAVTPITAFLIMPGVVLSFLLLPVGLEGLGMQMMEWGIAAMMLIAEAVSNAPYASVAVPSLTPLGFGMTIIGMCWFLLWRARWRLAGLALIAMGLATMLLHTLPDILISDDGKQIAIRAENGEWSMLKGGGKSFTAEAWAQAEGQEAILPKKEGISGVTCQKTHCVYAHGGYKIVFIDDWRAIKQLCESRPSLMVMRYVKRDGECEGVPVIDRNRLEKRGSHSIRLTTAGLQIEDAASYRGVRPWVAAVQP